VIPTDPDLFEVYRYLLFVACTVYAAVVTVRSLWSWVVYFSAEDRVTTAMRQYAIVSLLRLRVARFWTELAAIGVWTVLLVVILHLHRTLLPA
jgi:hypothetical protein